ncbi:class I SAM-dependent methyltransferase [Deinococcus sp.]|uniref:class I SAM-dependent methyltransferase n=1 Tax=Deinococcus sp. TaxID=47478 RepID=UPI0028698C5B|nr:class I SAM-dependent methyltransferase [Deinococcus sp.]
MRISTLEQLLNTLDGLFGDGSDWTKRDEQDHWAGLFSRPDHPLTSDLPDANLVDWRARGLLSGGEGKTALDIGCGLGRNTRYFARQGYRATGIDLSPYAVKEARERSGESGATFTECDVLRDPIPGGPYDVVYDSGCFHHLPPHRRLSYLNTLGAALKPGGLFGICTFAPGQMGTEADDLTLFRQGRLEGGIAYSLDDLREVFSGLEYLDGGPLRPPEPAPEAVFSMDFLHAALFRRPE